MAKQKQDDQLEPTYSSYVKTQDVTLKTCQRRWMIGRSGERWSGISVLAARLDDDDIYIYIYIRQISKIFIGFGIFFSISLIYIHIYIYIYIRKLMLICYNSCADVCWWNCLVVSYHVKFKVRQGSLPAWNFLLFLATLNCCFTAKQFVSGWRCM